MLKASITLLKFSYFVDQSDTESNLLNATFMRHLSGRILLQASFVGESSHKRRARKCRSVSLSLFRIWCIFNLFDATL